MIQHTHITLHLDVSEKKKKAERTIKAEGTSLGQAWVDASSDPCAVFTTSHSVCECVCVNVSVTGHPTLLWCISRPWYKK